MRQEFKGYGVFIFVIGLVLLLYAAILAAKTFQSEGANRAAGTAACGFAIGGSICFLAAALVYLGDRIAEYGVSNKSIAPVPEKPDGAAS